MSLNYQDINEYCAERSKHKEEAETAVINANKYLKSGKGDKPVWLDDFFKYNKYKLKETILRAISQSDGVSSLHGYNEGYFNEIVQNANDLHSGDHIDIKVNKSSSVYSVECCYSDKGFIITNIYALLNREMSDKSSEEEQTGKFGVGIKSFFKFVRKFRIESNVIFDFSINRKTNGVDSNVYINDHWDKKHTILSFEYDENEAESSGFNLKKLSELIDHLNDESSEAEEITKFFVSGQDNSIVFDIRSLIFMIGSAKKRSISKLIISGKSHRLNIVCKDRYSIQNIEDKTGNWGIRAADLNISLDNEECFQNNYLIFRHEKIDIGFSVSDDLCGDNRLYSTYYKKSDTNHNMLPIGMLINTADVNIHRNDIGDNEESIKKAYDKISDAVSDLFLFMCSENAASVQCLNEISTIFHSVLYKYIDEDNNKYKESPFNLPDLDNQYLPKTSDDTKTDIVVHKTPEDYQKPTPLDRDSATALTDLYYKVIERNNVIDYVELTESLECLDGVAQIYECIHNGGDTENYKTACKMLHYYSNVGKYITYAVSGEDREKTLLSDSEIDRWLNKLRKELGDNYDQDLCLKLIGRYKLNEALTYDGSLIKENLSFKDYLFNETAELKNGFFSGWQNVQYDRKYGELKQQLLANRIQDPGNEDDPFMVRIMKPLGTSRRGWDGIYDIYKLEYGKCKVSDENKVLLLEKMASDFALIRNVDLHKDNMRLFEKCYTPVRYRDKYFENLGIIQQQIICIDCLKEIQLHDFSKFLLATECLNTIEKYRVVDNINISCQQTRISTGEIIKSFLPQLVSLKENTSKEYLLSAVEPSNVHIDSIEVNSNNELPQENVDFIFKIANYLLFVSSFDSGSKKNVIAYWGNGMGKIKFQASDDFRPITSYNPHSGNVYIFYDNVSDINSVVSAVLNDLDIPKHLMEYLEGYIHNGHKSPMLGYRSGKISFARVKKKLDYKWAEIKPDDFTENDNPEIVYSLLTARGSYDIYCPICVDVPFETFKYGEDTRKKKSRRIIVMENENQETKADYPYIITVACTKCFEMLRYSLNKSEFDGKILTLTTQVAQGQYEKMRRKQKIELSPINVALMNKIKL